MLNKNQSEKDTLVPKPSCSAAHGVQRGAWGESRRSAAEPDGNTDSPGVIASNRFGSSVARTGGSDAAKSSCCENFTIDPRLEDNNFALLGIAFLGDDLPALSIRSLVL